MGLDMTQVQMEDRHQPVPVDAAPRPQVVSSPGPLGGARRLVRTIGRAAMVLGGGTDPAFGIPQEL
ncbi:MAG: hypothetical protein JWR13_1305 [Mycobacterium sp.]|jgi:hypothetical protein|nr:hypothetical protein [Mycobacterium sp.]